MKKWRGHFQVLGAGACFGFLGIFGKFAYQSGLSVGELLTLRFSLAATVLGLYFLLTGYQQLLIGKKQILISLLLGICGYAVFSTLYFESIKGITVGLASLLLFTFPLFVNLGAWLFLKEKLSRTQIFSLFLSSVGLVCLVWGDWSIEKSSAVISGLMAAITYSAYVLVSGQVQKKVPPMPSSFYVILGSAATLAIYNQVSPLKIWALTTPQVGIILGIAIICTISPLGLFLAGLQKMPSSQASILVTIEPVVASLAGALILSEFMNPLQILGATLILAALLLQSWKARPAESLS